MKRSDAALHTNRKMIKKFIYNMLEESGIKKDLIYINNNTPKNLNIFYFILMFLLSFLYFFSVFIIGFFFFIFYSIKTINMMIKNKENFINIECTNNYENSFLFFYKELIINYAKSKSFIIYYNFLKIIYKKKNKNVNVKVMVFTYLFKRIFKFVTFIPFTIFKINCTIYKRFKNVKELNSNNQSSLKAVIDHVLLNLYLEKISDEIKCVQNYKIIVKKNYIEFNPPKFNKTAFKNPYNYFHKKKPIESMSEFSIFKNKKEKDGFLYRHICKIFKVFKEGVYLNKNILFTETKASEIIDKNGNKIEGKLSDNGYKDKNIKNQ